uniref:Uncharacterized protein n=1 Tax=Aegilops tauschii TaxID=37682 RepID=M8BWZ4_AEGTA
MANLPSPTTVYKARLMEIPGYSKLWQMTPASLSTLVDTLLFRGQFWQVKMLPWDFVKGTSITIHILDESWSSERTAFHEVRQVTVDNGLAGMRVKRSELEAASCVHNAIIPMGCTLMFFDAKKYKKQQRAAARVEWWRRIRSSLSKNNILLRSNSNHRSTSSKSKPNKVQRAVIVEQPRTRSRDLM